MTFPREEDFSEWLKFEGHSHFRLWQREIKCRSVIRSTVVSNQNWQYIRTILLNRTPVGARWLSTISSRFVSIFDLHWHSQIRLKVSPEDISQLQASWKLKVSHRAILVMNCKVSFCCRSVVCFVSAKMRAGGRSKRAWILSLTDRGQWMECNTELFGYTTLIWNGVLGCVIPYSGSL